MEGMKEEVAQKPVPEISFIIPEYRADRNQLFQNLSLLNAQANFNFLKLEVLIVDDCSGSDHVITIDFYKQFSNLAITLVNLGTNGGPGIARQAGIDCAKGRYVMFGDADDIIAGIDVMSQLAITIESQPSDEMPFDILVTDWNEEVRTSASVVGMPNGDAVLLPDKYAYSKHENDATWMHGKLYRRQFLVDNAIRFDDLRVHEDRRFNIIAFALSQKTLRSPMTSYVWKYRPESITRAKGASYSYDSIAESVEAAARAYAELFLKSKEKIDLLAFDEEKLRASGKINPSQGIVQTIIYTYFVVQSWIGKIDNSYLSAIEESLASFYLTYKNVYNAYPYAMRAADMGAERDATARQMGPFIEKEPIAQFLWRVSATYKAASKGEEKK